MKRFEKMLQESLISENLVKDFLTNKFNLQFHCVPHIEQKAMITKNVHVPDILCVYNDENPMNVHKVDPEVQIQMAKKIRENHEKKERL